MVLASQLSEKAIKLMNRKVERLCFDICHCDTNRYFYSDIYIRFVANGADILSQCMIILLFLGCLHQRCLCVVR